MDDWSNKEWHKAVRVKLGEQKAYFRAQLRPYDISAAIRAIAEFRSVHRVDGIEANMIFGAYDFLLVGWLHPLIAKEIPARLAGILQTSQVPREFIVSSESDGIDHLTARQKSLLDTVLSVHTIRAVQKDGAQHRLFRDLEENRLIVEKPSYPRQTLRCFSTVTMHDVRKAELDGIQQDIERYAGSTETLLDTVVYRGSGFCHLLVESRVLPSNYFSVGNLTSELINICRRSEARVETYLPCDPTPLLEGDARIHDSTFVALKGSDPLVQSILPEAYSFISETADDVTQQLVKHASNARLTVKAKSLLRELLRPILTEDEANAPTALFVFFTQLEAFLKKHQGEFIASRSLTPKHVYENAGIKNPSDRMSLGDRLQAYCAALKLSKVPDEGLLGNWGPVIELRNDISHGRYGLDDWQRALSVLAEQHYRIDEPVALVCNELKAKYAFTYLGE